MSPRRLTHVDSRGRARMVDVSEKPETLRRAVAEGVLRVAPATLRAIRGGKIEKGDVLGVARLAGIQGAKSASTLIPLCHPIRLHSVRVDVEPSPPRSVRIRSEVVALDRTGVEMEALTSVAAAGLALYDMVKSTDRSAEIVSIRLVEKSGGRSGTWKRGKRRSA